MNVVVGILIMPGVDRVLESALQATFARIVSETSDG